MRKFMSLFIEKETDTDFSFDEEALAKEVTDYAIEHEGFPFEAEINLTLTDNDGIHAINKEYRDIDAPTDVLSFPMLSYESAGDFSKLIRTAFFRADDRLLPAPFLDICMMPGKKDIRHFFAHEHFRARVLRILQKVIVECLELRRHIVVQHSRDKS